MKQTVVLVKRIQAIDTALIDASRRWDMERVKELSRLRRPVAAQLHELLPPVTDPLSVTAKRA